MHKGEGITTGSFTQATPKIAVCRSGGGGGGDNDDVGLTDSHLGWAKMKHNPKLYRIFGILPKYQRACFTVCLFSL